jgi:hypothetical protein
VATFEFPHLLELVEQIQFDTIYHEHFSYLSLTAARSVLARNGLAVFDVEELSTHGGSLRQYAQRADTGPHQVSERVSAVAAREADAGMTTPAFYSGFQEAADRVKDAFLSFLIEAKRTGKSVAAYGAAAKGNTLINYAGIRQDLLRFVVDRNPAKQGKYTPGGRIPIVNEECLRRAKPDFIVVLPWNLKAEITAQLQYVCDWGGRLVTAVPRLEVA